uniref:DUF148 domain-containing protein n=1 Tax=Strongyloides papillosus TaxID=174720 RepID=A0A0N5CHY0_STREA
MSKILILILATTLFTFTPVCSLSNETRGGFVLYYDNEVGVNWNDTKVSVLGKLSEKVFENFKNIFNITHHNGIYRSFVKPFNDIATSEHGNPGENYLLKLIESSKIDLVSSNTEIKKKAVEKYGKILTNMSKIASTNKYGDFVKEVKKVFDFSSNADGKFKNYQDEILKLKEQLEGNEKLIIKNGDENKRLRNIVIEFLENKFLYVVLDFTENCPIELKFNEAKKEYTAFTTYTNGEIYKKCLKNYYGQLYKLLDKSGVEFEGKRMFEKVKSNFGQN